MHIFRTHKMFNGLNKLDITQSYFDIYGQILVFSIYNILVAKTKYDQDNGKSMMEMVRVVY